MDKERHMISIVIPVRNVNDMIEPLTSQCQKNIRSKTAEPYEICLSYFDESIAKTYNAGISESKGDIVCCLHNDVEVLPEWEYPLIEEAKNGNIAFPIVDDTKYCPEWRGISPITEWMPPGCCFMMTRETWDKIGNYDENYIPYHWEDTDLFYRAKKAGIKLIRTESKVIHWRGVTRGLMENKDKEYLLSGLEYFTKKHRDGLKALVYPILDNAKEQTVRYLDATYA